MCDVIMAEVGGGEEGDSEGGKEGEKEGGGGAVACIRINNCPFQFSSRCILFIIYLLNLSSQYVFVCVHVCRCEKGMCEGVCASV